MGIGMAASAAGAGLMGLGGGASQTGSSARADSNAGASSLQEGGRGIFAGMEGSTTGQVSGAFAGMEGSSTGKDTGVLGGAESSSSPAFSLGPLVGLTEEATGVLDGMPPSRLMEAIRDAALGLVTYNASAAVVPVGSELQGQLLGVA